jgi:hypothetical protein
MSRLWWDHEKLFSTYVAKPSAQHHNMTLLPENQTIFFFLVTKPEFFCKVFFCLSGIRLRSFHPSLRNVHLPQQRLWLQSSRHPSIRNWIAQTIVTFCPLAVREPDGKIIIIINIHVLFLLASDINFFLNFLYLTVFQHNSNNCALNLEDFCYDFLKFQMTS